MKVPKEINKLLSNKYVLYIVAFLSLTNVIAYLVAQDYNSLLFFAIIGYLVSYFSKNMTIILLCALTVTNLLMTAKSIQNQSGMRMHREGMEGMKVDIDTSDASDAEDKKGGKVPTGVNVGENKKGTKPSVPVTEDEAPTETQPGAAMTQPKQKEDFDVGAIQGGLAKSMENMSPNKMKEMGQEAGALLESQKQLAENLKTMGPLLNTAKEMMDTLSGSEGMLSKLGMIGGLM
ncbi:MAG: hypothetical protein ACXABD_00405 [Candidatus Thorarchaeota archaeon]|jgi:hypothetical protein